MKNIKQHPNKTQAKDDKAFYVLGFFVLLSMLFLFGRSMWEHDVSGAVTSACGIAVGTFTIVLATGAIKFWEGADYQAEIDEEKERSEQ